MIFEVSVRYRTSITYEKETLANKERPLDSVPRLNIPMGMFRADTFKNGGMLALDRP